MTNLIRYLKCVSLVIVFLGILVPLTLADKPPDLYGLSGGMSSDASIILSELLFWFVTIALAVCVIIAAWGVISSNSDQTKNGIKGTLFIICVVVLYYVGQFAIIYLKELYGA